MSNDLNRSIKIYIDGSEATAGVEKVKESIARLEQQLSGLSKTEKDYDKKSAKLRQELERKNKMLGQYEKKVEETDRVLKNLSGATYNELVAVQRQLRKELANLVPGTQRYNTVLQQQNRVSQQVIASQRAMHVQVAAQRSIWQRASGWVNNYIGIIGTAVAAITGVTMKLNQLREKRNEREVKKDDVGALTGLNDSDINWLESKAKEMSTTMDENKIRIEQSATEILEAYKLVGSAKPELLSNKEALNSVTKQTLILAKASGMQLKDAVEGTTLAMNQFGAGAEEAGRYVNVMAAGSKFGSASVESVTKALRNCGVAASSANISIEETVGVIETLAEKGIKDEVAGTGLKKMFLTLQTGADDTNPKVVGLTQALQNLAAKGLTATDIKKQFGEEGYNVASVLINEADKVNSFTEAVTGTSVALEQASRNSGNASSKLAQAKNKMNEMGIELMDTLNPALVSAASGLVNWTRHGVDFIAFLVENRRTIAAAAAGIAAYTVVVKGATWANKLYTLGTKAATVATIAFNTAMKANPLGLIAGLLATAVTFLISFRKKTEDATEAQADFNEEVDHTTEILQKVTGLFKEYNNLDLLTPAQVKKLKSRTSQTIDELNDIIKDKMIESRDLYQQGLDRLSSQIGLTDDQRDFLTKKLEEENRQRAEQINIYINQRRELEQKLASLPDDDPKKSPETTTTASSTKDPKAEAFKQALQAEKDLYYEHVQELKRVYVSQEDENLKSQAEYNEALEQLEMMHLQRMLELAGLSAEERKKIEEQLLDFQVKCVNEANAENERRLQEEREKQKDEEDKKEKEEKEENERRQRAEQTLLEERVRTYQSFGQKIGGALGQVMLGQENAMQNFADTMIDIVFDVLSQLVEAEIAKVTITATGAAANSKMIALGLPDSVITGGAAGIARAAVLSAIIMGALTAAKTALHGILGGGGRSHSAEKGSQTYERRVTQHAAGQYDVIGADDGRTYRGVPYIGPAPTGIISSPALISESGAELIVNAPDLERLRRHINYPLVMEAIADSRRPVPQYAAGRYDVPEQPDDRRQLSSLLTQLMHLLSRLEKQGVHADVSMSDIRQKTRLLDKARSITSKKQ